MFYSKVVFRALVFTMIAVGLGVSAAQEPKALVEKMVAAIGGMDRLYQLKDVEYEYAYIAPDGKKDVSIERYIFDGELSWAKFTTREKYVFPDMTGEIVMGYDGKESWMTQDGALIRDPQVLRMADFSRKTNFYWFAMMFKMLDPGLIYESLGKRTVDNIDYDVVKVTFETGVGDAQDTYILYLNPETYLVDQFLFTVMDFGMKEPSLMKVDYEEIDGVKLPTRRVYIAADWDGNIKGEEWTQELSTNIKFNNGFKRSLFEKPGS